MEQKDKILITGASGSLGRELVHQLVHRGFANIHVCIRSKSIIPESWHEQAGLYIHRGDLLDYYWVQQLMQKADYVFNMAGATSSKAGTREKLEQSNIELTRTWVNIALQENLQGFVHISSAAALGRKKDGSLCSEKDSWQKNEVYSDYNKTKFLGELEAARGQAEGLPTIILNPSNIISNEGILALVHESIINGNRSFPVGSGGYVNVEDVAKFAIEATMKGLWGEKYILSAENLPHKEVFQTVASVIDERAPSRPMTSFSLFLLKLKSYIKSTYNTEKFVPSIDWYRMLQANFAYDNRKSISTGLITYSSIKESIRLILQEKSTDSSPIRGRSSMAY